MNAKLHKVSQIQFKKSTISGLFFQVGIVRMAGKSVYVFRGNGQDGWARCADGQFK